MFYPTRKNAVVLRALVFIAGARFRRATAMAMSDDEGAVVESAALQATAAPDADSALREERPASARGDTSSRCVCRVWLPEGRTGLTAAQQAVCGRSVLGHDVG